MNGRDAVDLLAIHVGLRELSGKNDGASELFTGGRREPWCAHAVAWAHRCSGHPLPGDISPTLLIANPIASVAEMERLLGTVKAWRPADPAAMLQTIRRGALLFHSIRGESDTGPGRHVDLLESIDRVTQEMTVLSPNWGDALVRRKISLAAKSLEGYANWPPLPDARPTIDEWRKA